MTTGETLVRRFYDELWNDWRIDVAGEILDQDLRFRGSLGSHERGLVAFLAYLERVRGAFPDWHNQLDELIVAGERLTARLTWTGTHRGQFAGLAATGRRVRYVGAGFFTVAGGRISEAWIVGDTQELWRSLGVFESPLGLRSD